MNWYRTAARLLAGFSFVGLVLATLFFAASLTPSLLPRTFAAQGILSGLALAVGYGVGVLVVWLWNYLEAPHPRAELQRIGKILTVLSVVPIVTLFLWRATIWQNSIRELMSMEPVASAYPTRVAAIALAVAAAVLLVARGLRICWCYVHERTRRVIPRRVSYVLSTLAIGALLLLLVNDVIARLLLNAADAMFLQIDKVADDSVAGEPADSLASGGPGSLIDWESIGVQGKRFVLNGPTVEQISDFWGDKALRPLRIYAGLRSAETDEERARLALAELIRVGGFERSVLVVATPTGTGWLDPGAVDTIEYLHRGDTAIVSMQYSYLPSWITILVDPRRSRESASVLFDEVYAYWRQLPRESRPKIYLHGLSLGALGSESSADLFTVFEDPIHGALWSGPPFPSSAWRKATDGRNPGSPFWLPQFRDGSVLRFTGRKNTLDQPARPWGKMRLVYLQHASDPMTFFSPDLLWQRPEWIVGERGPDVSPYLRWYPIVTFLQTAFDLPMATAVPHGYGHNYAAASYLECWAALTDPPDWDATKAERLTKLLTDGLPW